MDNLRYLEITRAFNNYYKTLRDMNVYLLNDPDVDEEELRTASLVISRLIFEFIRVNGTTFLDMDSGEFEKDYQIFKDDFLNIIQSSGENNVDFEELTELVDDLLEIADHRAETLGKINRGFVVDFFEDEDDEIDFMDVEDIHDEDEDENDEIDFMDVEDIQDEIEDETETETEVVSSSDDTDDNESSEDEDESSDEGIEDDEESEDENESSNESDENEDESSAHLVQDEDDDEVYGDELGNEDLVEVKVKVEVEEEKEDMRNDDYEEYDRQDYRIYRRKRYD